MAIKSFDQIKAAVEAVARKKQAAESNMPVDPNEVAIPSISEEGMISEQCLDVPQGKANDKAVEKETSSFPVKSSEEEAAINPTEEDSVEVTEKAVTKQGSDLLSKIQNSMNKESTEVKNNVAEGINLSTDALAKIASEILATEEGARFTTNLFRKKAGEEYAKATIEEAVKQVTQYKEMEKNMTSDPIAKLASELSTLPQEYQEEIARRIQVHSTNLEEYEHELLKRAYAAGAEDAEAMIQNPELLDAAEEPTVEEAGAAEISPEEVMEAVNEMVASGEIDEATANALIEEIVAGAEGGEEADEEAIAEAAAAEGLAEDVNADPISAAAEEGPAKLASEIVKGTILLKKASAEEGLVEDEEASLQDVVSVVQQLAEEGSISEEDALSVLEEIASALTNEESEAEEAEEESEDDEEEAEESEEEADEDEADALEAVQKVASVLNR